MTKQPGGVTGGACGIPLGLAVVTVVAFAPSLWNEFVEWDDHLLLTGNPAYRGLGWAQLRWMATTVLLGHYAPLTWLSFGLDYVVWGMRPAGYHLTNLVLHTTNVVLFYLLAARLLETATALPETARQVGAATAALLFAVHPLRAESVAWVTERRGVLSGLFFLVTVLVYLKACAAEGRRRRWLLVGSVGAYLLALGSKAIVMTLPVVLVLLDVYPLRRLSGDPRAWWGRSARWVWLEKAPYLVLAVAGAVTSRHAVLRGTGETPLEWYGWMTRVGMVVQTLWFHVYKTVLPSGLSPLYEAPARINPLERWFLVSAGGVVGITVTVLLLRRVWPAGLATWLYYGIVLAPVSGLAHVGPQLTADRYSYLSCLGWAMLAGAGTGTAVRAAARGTLRPSLARLIAVGAVTAFLGLGVLTWHQVQVWRNTERLWRHAVAVTSNCSVCHLNMGNWLYVHGVFEEARGHFQQALAIRPDEIRVHANLGLVLAQLGRFPEAVEHYERVLGRYPDAMAVRNNLATVLMQMGRLAETVEELRRMVRFNNPEGVAGFFGRAVESRPDDALPRLGLIQAYLALGKPALAREQYEVLRALNPALASLVADAFAP